MQRGVLLEVDGRYAVVLTPRGEFKRVPVPQGTWEIGDEVSFAEPRQIPWVRYGMVAAAAVLMLVFAPVGYQTWALAQPAAIITVDINPSLELTLNVKDQVLTAEALNDDGKLVLNGVDWKRQPVGAVIEQVTAKAVAVGKLNPADAGSAVLVAVAPAKGKSLDAQHEEKLLTGSKAAVNNVVAKEAKSKKVEPKTNVAALAATPAERDEAEKDGLTPGKYLLYKELQAQVPEIKPEELKNQGPGKLLNSLGINPGEIFGQAEEHHGGQKKGQQEKQGSGEEPGRPATARPNPGSDDAGAGKADKDQASKEKPDKEKVDKEKVDKEKGDTPSREKADNPSREKAGQERGGGEKEKAAPEKQKQETDKQDREKEKGRSSNEGYEKRPSSSSLDLGITLQTSEQPRAATPGAEPSVGPETKPAEQKPEQVEPKPDKAEQKPERVEQKPEQAKQKPGQVEQKPDKAEQQPEQKPDKGEHKQEKSGGKGKP